MMNKIKVIFWGTPDIGLKSLEYLYNSDRISIAAVVTQPDRPAGRGNKIKMPPVKEFALSKNLPVYQPKCIRKEPDVIEELRRYEPDFFVTFAFGQILSQEVLDIPKFETINLHASLLPKYRGANPIQRVIINGEKETGICTMITELGLDCGDICLKKTIQIPENMTCEDLWRQISADSPELLEKTIIGIYENKLTPTPQCENGVCIANKVSKDETLIDWSKSARDIHNLVRGIYKSPGAYFKFNNKIIKVLQTEVIPTDECVCDRSKIGEIVQSTKDGITMLTGDGFIKLVKVKPEGKSEMNAKDWYNGIRNTK
ncbi:MAG: methionyl-tRNA formyltransferase [Candidatus Gastranaerophilales bacterium]|nr:methionyl-tRNA formyltransferase [Candidatus Gastranaerophilales bacterium]